MSNWYSGDLKAVAKPSKLADYGSLTLLNRFGVSASGAMLDVANLLVENFPDDAEQPVSDSPDG
jgi:allophanate hydrolase subunit 2